MSSRSRKKRAQRKARKAAQQTSAQQTSTQAGSAQNANEQAGKGQSPSEGGNLTAADGSEGGAFAEEAMPVQETIRDSDALTNPEAFAAAETLKAPSKPDGPPQNSGNSQAPEEAPDEDELLDMAIETISDQPEAAAAAEDEEDKPGRVLLVDDNARYREAFSRHLELEGYEVETAGDAGEAIDKLGVMDDAELLITDLDMRTPREGLDLIREARRRHPLLPVILISAVGTFEEGAEAMALGAVHVASKMSIETEMEPLIARIEAAREQHRAHRELMKEIAGIRQVAASFDLSEEEEQLPDAEVLERYFDRVTELLGDEDLPAAIHTEAYEVFAALNSQRLRQEAARSVSRAIQEAPMAGTGMAEIDTLLKRELDFEPSRLDGDTLEALRTAEFLYQQPTESGVSIDFSRNIGFSYCFAVENQAKNRMRQRLRRFLNDPETFQLMPRLFEKDKRHLNLFYHQHLAAALQGREIDISIDNVRQTFLRMLEHKNRYKPDGLKALGILIICFGREYSFFNGEKEVTIKNLLSMRGLEDEYEALDFAELLISLQHYRNPYIHPEISEMEKVSKIRQTTLDCLNYIQKLK